MRNSFPFNLKPFRILILLTLSLAAPVCLAASPFFWEVEKEGRVSYVLGTIHSSHPEVREIPDPVMEALTQSRVFLPELDLSYANIGRMTAAAFDFGGEPWKERVPEGLYSRARSAADRIGLPEFMLRNLAFEMIPVFFALPPDEDFFQVMDVRLYREARERGIEIVALETIEEQLAVFQNLGDAIIIELIDEALDEAEQGYPQYRRIVEAYASGRESAILKIIEELKEQGDETYVTALLDRRNQTMTERALPSLEEGGAFIAVGLAHLPGPSGMIELLQAQGFTITRMNGE